MRSEIRGIKRERRKWKREKERERKDNTRNRRKRKCQRGDDGEQRQEIQMEKKANHTPTSKVIS